MEKESSGTLGGSINFIDSITHATTTYALTNYHVLRPEKNGFLATIDKGEITSA